MERYHQLSSCSSTDQEDMTSEEIGIRKLAKSILLNQIFIATYQERRYVQSLNAYRDVIRVHHKEHDLLKALKHVKKRIEESNNKSWLGITDGEMVGAPVGICLWIQLPEQSKLGKYWFKIRAIKFRKNEIIVKVQTLREANTPDANPLISPTDSHEFVEIVKENVLDILTMTKIKLFAFFQEILTVQNTKSAFVYVSAVLVTVFFGLVQLLQYLAEYLLRLCRELSILTKSFTPILIALINMIGKMFSNLFYMIYLLFKGDSRHPQRAMHQPYNYVQYQPVRPHVQRALPYYGGRSNAIITELN